MAGIGKRGRFAKPLTLTRRWSERAALAGGAGIGVTDFRALAGALLGAFHGTAPPFRACARSFGSIPPLGSMCARDYHLPARP